VPAMEMRWTEHGVFLPIASASPSDWFSWPGLPSPMIQMVGDFVKAGAGLHEEIIHCNAMCTGLSFRMKILLSILLATAIPISGQSEEPTKKRSPKKQTSASVEGPSKTTGKKKSVTKDGSPGISDIGSVPSKEKKNHGRPAVIDTEKLVEFETLPEDRKSLIRGAIEVAKTSPWLPYVFGGSDPKAGGFDCSGAMYYVMCKADLEPPRSSAEQFLWLKENNRLTEISPSVKTLDHPDFKKLLPGDLLFWGGTYAPADGRKVDITHVAMYLGHEKPDNRAVMINATDGRSYRGKQANGYGVYDFQLPRDGSKAAFMGYGTPPGIKQ
jgi:cell wall-associated NlpC family hydrolase